MRTSILTACLILALVPAAQAQPRKEAVYSSAATRPPGSPRLAPPSFRAAIAPPREVALKPLAASQAAAFAVRSDPLLVGIHRELPEGALGNGAWETTADGRKIWRLAVRSPGSAGIRVHFTDFSAGSGRVWLHDGQQFAGPYTGTGLFDNGDFWSDTIFSESVTIEYEPADPSDETLPFRIQTMAHQADTATTASPAQASSLLLQDAPPAAVKDPADTCHQDPNCYPDWRGSMSMVGQIVFEKEGNEYVCSGALVATRNNSQKPYFLTAGHCVSGEDVARTVETYWTYQKSSCTGPLPDRKDSTKSSPGAHLLTAGSLGAGDYSLLLLRDVPAGVAYAGWDASPPPIGASLVGIHHPSGSYKRISFGHRVGDAFVVIDGYQNPSDNYYQVQWDKGRTEPGSSGSPLFSGPGIVVGTLTYGPVSDTLTVCQITPSVDGYGRLSIAYPYMRDYLEDLPASTVVPGPGNVRFVGRNGAFAAGASQRITLTTQSANAVDFKARADSPWIKLSAMTGKVSAGAPFALDLSVDPRYFARAGTYTSTVTVTSGAADPRFINVRVEMAVERSQVAVSFAPNPVVEQAPDADGARWVFKVRLDEQAGVATRITTLRINGTDYSAAIPDWFGGDLLAAKGSLQAALRASGVFAYGDQYFEFSGADEASGQKWYQAVTVSFQPAP